MFALGPIVFTAPWLLLGLISLPVLWILLRVVPPAPIRRRFPGIALLLGLSDEKAETDKTPWWLLLLRMAAVAAAIIAFAGPVLNPQTARPGSGPLVVLIDGSWADAGDWSRRQDRVASLLAEALAAARPVAVVMASDPPSGQLNFVGADQWQRRIAGLTPNPWSPSDTSWIRAQAQDFETYWVSDGISHPAREDMLGALQTKGPVTVFEGGSAVYALRPARFEDGLVVMKALRAIGSDATELSVAGYGLDPVGIERALAEGVLEFEAGAREAEMSLSLPPELRNRITRFQLTGIRSAAAVSLTDDSLKRREVALLTGRDDREGLELLSPGHYLRQALEPTAELLDAPLGDVLLANPDVIILADVARVGSNEAEALLEWVEEGGLLVRFAGPRLAASDVSRAEEDPLLPVRLRVGGRSVGGAMSWGEPKSLRKFEQASPFFGLEIPEDVNVTSQVVAQPDPDLASRVIASLADGTPLVTRKRAGQGQIVLFHVTANAEWSSLPLSGLFVQMLERLAISTRPERPDAKALEGTTWVAAETLDAFGGLESADTLAGVAGEALATDPISGKMPPGVYENDVRRLALNVMESDSSLEPAAWPASVPVEGLLAPRETRLKGAFLTAAMGLLLLDIIAALFLSGRLFRGAGHVAGIALIMLLPNGARAADELHAIEATRDVVIAHVITGDPEVDRIAFAGLRGLGDTLFRRTSIEPREPVSIDLETDELAFYPLLYWPISAIQPLPSPDAYARLNRYLRSGGMIVFDTRDADIGGFGSTTPESRKLQQLAAGLDIPALEPLPDDHVLTRAFYLLQNYPGRYAAGDVWVEAAPPDAERAEGMPFRNLNDGVTPVVIGSNDWAAAWAIDQSGNWMFPVGRGYGGERQREMAFRFGVNLMMHVLTGNYKSDQVHVPALLDRLGN